MCRIYWKSTKYWRYYLRITITCVLSNFSVRNGNFSSGQLLLGQKWPVSLNISHEIVFSRNTLLFFIMLFSYINKKGFIGNLEKKYSKEIFEILYKWRYFSEYLIYQLPRIILFSRNILNVRLHKNEKENSWNLWKANKNCNGCLEQLD